MTISDQAKSQVIRLIDEGESLNPFDLESFYNWVEASHEVLEFHVVQQRRFDEYCRASYDSPSMRLFVGVWILKLALEEASPVGSSCLNSLASTKSVPHLPRKRSAGPRRRR
jgi:hypothetical protein